MNALLRLAAWMLAIVMVAMPVIAVVNGWIGGERWPMKRLVVTGEFAQVSETQVRTAVLPAVHGGFFAVDLKAVSIAVAELPWVANVQVRKRWPDRLDVSLSEHRPVAFWGEKQMLAESGQLFLAPDAAAPTLPHFVGPEDRIGDVMAFHKQAEQQFLPQGLGITEVQLSARGSWQVQLDNGLRIEIGREQSTARLARFARLLPTLGRDENRQLISADLRYTNGFALIWQDAAMPLGPLPTAPQPAISHPLPNPPPQSGGGSNTQAST